VIVTLDQVILEQIEALYSDMERAYDHTASQLGHTCNGCPDNCCDSYFLHFTYIEWSYLWHGVNLLAPEKQQQIIGRALDYEAKSMELLARRKRPRLMCPLNEEGRCTLYNYRLMVCRTHGVPAEMTRPDGQKIMFPGCFRCQELVDQGGDNQHGAVMERTPLLKRLVVLEQRLLAGKKKVLPKVRMTIAGMLKAGPPQIPHCSDR